MRRFLEDFADSFGIDVDAVDASDEVPAVALHEDGIFGPVVVFVVSCQGLSESGVVATFGVEDAASMDQ